MGRPRMTEDQRAVAVALLANAIRKDERLAGHARDRAEDDLGLAVGAGARAEASRSYVRGMRDLLAVLFAGGRAAADECYEAARVQAAGDQTAT